MAAKKKARKPQKKWMQKLDIKEGALHKQLGVPADQPIPASKLQPSPSDSALLAKRKNLARVFAKANKRKKRTKKS